MANQLSSQIYRGDTGQPFKPRTGFSNWLQGNPELFQQITRYSPEMSQGLEQLFSQGLQGLQNPQAGFQPFADQAINKFNTQTVPGLAERFTSMGGGQRSSAFQNALGSAGANLNQNLAAMESQYGLQNRAGLLDQLKLGLTPSFHTIQRPKQAGFLEGLLGPMLGGGSYRGNSDEQQDLALLLSKLIPFLL